MPRVRIKICGIMDPRDALFAARAGADAIGMVFYPGARRSVAIDRAREILQGLPAFVTPVALFVDQDVEEIRRITGELHIRHVQLHGRESPQVVADLAEFSVLKAIRTDRATLDAELDRWSRAVAELKLTHLVGLVMESPVNSGGSGVENDWDALADAQSRGRFANLPPLIAAGGLHPGNVARVIRQLRPWAVDVSSGVEAEFGRKSEQKIQQFIGAAVDACTT